MLLEYHLFYLLIGYIVESLNKQKIYHFILVIIIPLFMCILPLILNIINNNKYKIYGIYNAIPFNKDCWLVNKYWQLCQTILISIALVFHYIVIIITIYKMNFNKKTKQFKIIKRYYKNIIIKYIRFIIVYSILWIIPNYYNLFECF